MVITRKIEIYVHEEDKDMKKNYMQTIYGWRDAVRKAAGQCEQHRAREKKGNELFHGETSFLFIYPLTPPAIMSFV